MKAMGALSFVTALAALGIPSAYADSVTYGAISRCDPDKGIFELGAYVEFNTQITVGVSSLNKARALPPGVHKIKCNLGGWQQVLAEVEVHRASNGECMGAGTATLKRLSVGSQQILGETEVSGGLTSCYGGKVLVSARLRRLGKSTVTFSRCSSPAWTWEAGYPDVSCENDKFQQ